MKIVKMFMHYVLPKNVEQHVLRDTGVTDV